MGYSRAGFDVIGVDIKHQPNYPFRFHQMDALRALGVDEFRENFDAIHASPPCQAYSSATADHSKHPDLYEPTRKRLEAVGLPWVIENVIGAPYRQGIVLCGSMFGLEIYRHRNFESSFLMMPPHCRHSEFGRPYTITGHLSTEQEYRHSKKPSRQQAVEIMGMPWATWDEAVLAIPPAYTEWIGTRLMEYLSQVAV